MSLGLLPLPPPPCHAPVPPNITGAPADERPPLVTGQPVQHRPPAGANPAAQNGPGGGARPSPIRVHRGTLGQEGGSSPRGLRGGVGPDRCGPAPAGHGDDGPVGERQPPPPPSPVRSAGGHPHRRPQRPPRAPMCTASETGPAPPAPGSAPATPATAGGGGRFTWVPVTSAPPPPLGQGDWAQKGGRGRVWTGACHRAAHASGR